MEKKREMRYEDSYDVAEQFDDARHKFLKVGKNAPGDDEVTSKVRREIKDKHKSGKDRDKPYRTMDRSRSK